MKNKKAQEEMVGFSLIIIIVAIIILVLFSVSLRSKGNIQESYETDNFMQAFLQYTTECSVGYNSNYLDVRRLIRKCAEDSDSKCLNDKDTCFVLNQTVTGILEQSWQVGEEWPYKGYNFTINYEDLEVLSISKGVSTINYKGSSQNLDQIDIFLKIYS